MANSNIFLPLSNLAIFKLATVTVLKLHVETQPLPLGAGYSPRNIKPGLWKWRSLFAQNPNFAGIKPGILGPIIQIQRDRRQTSEVLRAVIGKSKKLARNLPWIRSELFTVQREFRQKRTVYY
jgi:hypothetical protein